MPKIINIGLDLLELFEHITGVRNFLRHSVHAFFRIPTPAHRTSLSSQHIRPSGVFNRAGPKVWNSLPDELRDPACNSDSFKQFLNTILFSLY